MSAIRDAVDGAYRDIKMAEAVLATARANCPHPSYRIGLYSWRIGCIDKKRLCDECDSVLGDPTIEEAAACASPFDEPTIQFEEAAPSSSAAGEDAG